MSRGSLDTVSAQSGVSMWDDPCPGHRRMYSPELSGLMYLDISFKAWRYLNDSGSCSMVRFKKSRQCCQDSETIAGSSCFRIGGQSAARVRTMAAWYTSIDYVSLCIHGEKRWIYSQYALNHGAPVSGPWDVVLMCSTKACAFSMQATEQRSARRLGRRFWDFRGKPGVAADDG